MTRRPTVQSLQRTPLILNIDTHLASLGVKVECLQRVAKGPGVVSPDIGDLDPEVHLVVGVNRPLGIQPKAYILDFIVLLVYRTTLEGTVGLSTVSLSPGAGETATAEVIAGVE